MNRKQGLEQFLQCVVFTKDLSLSPYSTVLNESQINRQRTSSLNSFSFAADGWSGATTRKIRRIHSYAPSSCRPLGHPSKWSSYGMIGPLDYGELIAKIPIRSTGWYSRQIVSQTSNTTLWLADECTVDAIISSLNDITWQLPAPRLLKDSFSFSWAFLRQIRPEIEEYGYQVSQEGRRKIRRRYCTACVQCDLLTFCSKRPPCPLSAL